MTRLGGDIPPAVDQIRDRTKDILMRNHFQAIDASSRTTGRDFLYKIWKMIVGVPVGIAIVHKRMPKKTMSNVYYEIGMMQVLEKSRGDNLTVHRGAEGQVTEC